MNRLRSCLLLGAACTLVLATEASPQGLHVLGYGNVEYLNQQGSGSTFDAHNLNLIVLGQLRGDIFAAAEVEYEHGGDEIALEYAYLAFTRVKYLNIVAGKFIVPFGSFNANHPAWINKVPGRPFGFDRVVPATYSDVGLMVRGGVATGRLTRVTYDAWVVNGLAGDSAGDMGNARQQRRCGPVEVRRCAPPGGVGPMGFDIGASVHSGAYNSANDLDLTLVGADATFQRAGFELKGEVVKATQETSTADLKKTGYYLQASYLAGSWFEPAIRFSEADFPGASNRDLREVSVGASLYASDVGVLRLFYRVNKELSVAERKDNLFTAQFTVAF
jgi:hypothetical protein